MTTALAYALVLVATIAALTALLIFAPEQSSVAIPLLVGVVTSVLALLRANTAATTSEDVKQETIAQTRKLEDIHQDIQDTKERLA